MTKLSRQDREKLAREEGIILSAEKIFSRKGFDDASMDEIAKEAEFTKRTVYQYFKSKEDLYFAVVFKGFRMLYDSLQEIDETDRNGFEKVKKAFQYFYEFYKEKPEIFRILNYLGYVKKKSVESKRRDEFLALNNEVFLIVEKIIEEGKSDGSISNKQQSNKMAFSLVFLITSFLNQLSAVGNDFTDNFSLDMEEFSNFSMELILGTLTNNQE